MSASSVLPATVLPRRDSCICGKEQCRLLTICFQSCNDFRGQFMMLPTTEGDRLVDLKEFKLKRTLIHLDMASPNTHKKNLICSTDNRDRRANVVSPDSSDAASAAATNNNNNNDGNNNDNSEDDNDSNNIGSTEINVRIRLNGRLKPNSSTAVLNNYELQNCRDAPTAKASAKYVANHHFQPEILQAMLDQGKTNIDCLPVQLIKDLGLIDNGYTNADLFHGKVPDADGKTSPVYVPVPSYKNAEDDYKSVSNRWRLNRIIKDCRMKRRGKSTLAPRGQDNILRPVDKRAKIDALPAMDSESVDDLQRAVCMLSDELDAANEKIKRLEDESKLKDLLSREGLADIERLSKETMGGLTRLNITSDDYHRRHKNVAKNLFGFEDRTKGGKLSSWDITKQFIKDMWDVNHVEPTISTILDDSGRKKSMSKFEQVLITLMWFQNLHDHSYLASIWGCSKDIIGTTIKWWAPHFYEVGCQLARLPLDEEFMKKSYPQSYLDLNFPAPVASVVDGTDVLCQSVRKHRAVNVIQRSNKIEHSAFRGVTWSLPMGIVHEFTDPFFARASEKALVRLWAGHGRFKDIPIGWLISGDKGFDQTSVFYPHYNQILHPAFLTGGDKAQFSEKQIGWNRKACEKRYTSEVVFARFKKYGGMGQILERHSFHYVHYLWAWAHGMANFGYLPLQTPANTDYFPESKYSRK